jgi:nitrogen fixation protein FixH
MKTLNRWPLLIMLLVAGFFALTAWSFHRAARGASAVTDPDYYSHGLRYDQTMLEQKTAVALGWVPVVRLQGRQVIIELRDRSQRAVTQAQGALLLSDPGKRHPRKVTLNETGSGSYQAELPENLRGEHTAEITFLRDGARLSRRLLLSLK